MKPVRIAALLCALLPALPALAGQVPNPVNCPSGGACTLPGNVQITGSFLKPAGPVLLSGTSYSAAYPAQANLMLTLKSAGAGVKTVNLFPCSGAVAGTTFGAVDAQGNAGSAGNYISFVPYGSETILGANAALDVQVNNASVELSCDGAGNWSLK